MAYRNIRTYIKPHTSDSNGGTNIYIGGNNNNLNTDNLSVINFNAVNIDANKIKTRYIDADNANILYLMVENGQIKKLEGNELNFTSGHIGDLDTSSINTNTLNVNDSAVIKNTLTANNILSNNIVTDYLTVNKSAHFFELIIDKIRSVQGTQINTAANCIVDFVEAYDSNNNKVDIESNNVDYYRIYWKNTDDDGRAITNDWLVYDQALCESFNVGTGVSYDVSNKYYWRLVTNTDNGTPKYVNLSTGEVKNTLPSNYEITFPNRFKFGNASAQQWFTDFTIDEQSTLVNPSIINEWDDTNNLWTLNTTQFGLQLTAPDALLIHASFEFTTNIKTKLNIGVYYADGSFDYFPTDTYKTSYSIETAESKNVEAIVILSSVIDKWDACNWIDLSNSNMDVTVSGKSAIPSIGDNVCQLGYRYTELTNPTQDDINRASAIIIAAYNTPDSGIVPPSYAQYQNITDYSLGSHRKSYFDATGCYIVGNFAVQAAGSTTPLDDYIKSFNNANPLEGFISTNNNQNVDLIVLQTDNSNKIYDLNNFPNNLQVMVNYEGTPQMSISDYDTLTLTLFGVQYNLLDANNYTPSLPSGYQGIYVSNITKSQYQPFRLTLAFTGNEQVITTSSMILHAEITNSGTTYQLNKNIPINGVSSVEGTDAELWQLYKDTEYAEVRQNKSLNVQLRYAIQHVVGITSTIVAPTNQKLKITRYKLDGTALNTTILTNVDYISSGGKTGSGYWEYTYTLANWYTEQNKPIYFLVELLDNNDNILSNTIVDITLESSSLFTVEEGLTQSIQANTTAINDEVQTRQTQYSAITQTVNNINSTVSSHTTSINNMSTEISEIDQKADRIGLHVDSVETDLNGVVTDLSSTGIDIEQGKITLSAENTVIDGDLDLSGDFESYNPTTQNRTRITTKRSGTSGLIMSGPDRVDPITGEPDPNTQEADLIKMEFVTTGGARGGAIKVLGANSSNIYTNIWQESIGMSNDDNYIVVRPEGITYGLRGAQTYDWRKNINNQSMTLSWPAVLCGSYTNVKTISSGSSYNATLQEGIIIIKTGINTGFKLYLPSPDSECAGKFYFIKNKSNRTGSDCKITVTGASSSNKLILDNNGDYDYDRNLDHDSLIVCCDGEHWIMFGNHFD